MIKAFITEDETTLWWSEDVRLLKRNGDYADALKICYKYWIYPGAFTEGALCLRALIRNRLSKKEDPTDLVQELHYNAACFAFYFPTQSQHIHQETEIAFFPGHEIACQDEAHKQIDLSYKNIGYKKLVLPLKTDVKWFAMYLDDTNSHTTPHDQIEAKTLRDKYNPLYELQVKESRISFLAGIDLSDEEFSPPPVKSLFKKTLYWQWFIIKIFIGLILLMIFIGIVLPDK